jgi:hypothetical protein
MLTSGGLLREVTPMSKKSIPISDN